MHSGGLFPQIWSPLGSSLLVTNEPAFLTVGILEKRDKSQYRHSDDVHEKLLIITDRAANPIYQ